MAGHCFILGTTCRRCDCNNYKKKREDINGPEFLTPNLHDPDVSPVGKRKLSVDTEGCSIPSGKKQKVADPSPSVNVEKEQ